MQTMNVKPKLNLDFVDETDVGKMSEDDSSLSDSDTSTMTMKEDDDSAASLDDFMASFRTDDDDREEEEEDPNDQPSILYMGREYKADQFRHSATVLSQSSISRNAGGRSHINNMSMRHNNASSYMLNLNDRWARLEEEVLAVQSKPSSSRGLTMSQSEHWGTSTRRAASPPRIIEESRSSRIHTLIRTSITTSLRRNFTTPPAVPAATLAKTPSKKIMKSESEHFGSTRRGSASATLPVRSDHRLNASISCGTSSIYKVVNKYISPTAFSAQQLKEERWQKCINRWGYSNHDVLGIVEDGEIFAKLQRDLRSHHAITNNVIQQKIHVFVHNTKNRRHTVR